ncbi:MAG: hypothetical protein V3V35_01500 [Dehalococcoidia bacterium]
MPVAFTEPARAALKRLLDESDVEPGQLIRMVSDLEGNFHLTVGAQEDDDQVVTWESAPVLVIKASISEHLCEHHPGATLDVKETPEGPTLVMTGSGR